MKEQYNPFTGETRPEAEKSGKDVPLENEKKLRNELENNHLLSQANQIVAETESTLNHKKNHQEMTDYEKKWAKNKEEALDMINPAKNILQQEIIVEQPINEEVKISPEPSIVKNTENNIETRESYGKKVARKFRQYVGPILGAAIFTGPATEINAAKNKPVEPAILESTYNAPSETNLAKSDNKKIDEGVKIKKAREALTPKVLKDLQEKYDKKFKQEAREAAEELLKDQEKAAKKAKKDQERAEKEKEQEEARLIKEQNKKLAKELEPQIIEAEKARFEEYKNAALSAIAKEREAEKIAEEKKNQEKDAQIKAKDEAKKEAEMRKKLAPKVAEALRKKYQEELEKGSNK